MRRLVLSTLLPLAVAPAPAHAFTARVPDPAGGPDWAARAWVRPPKPRDGNDAARCIQIGQVDAGHLVRRFADGSARPLGPRDRVICGRLRGSFAWTPLLVERYADSAAAPTRLTRTVVAGVMPQGMVSVRIAIRGQAPRPVPVQGSPRTYLAVLSGAVRRRDVVLRFRNARGRDRLVDFSTGRVANDGPFRPVVPGSIRAPLTLPDQTGSGPPVALTAYRIDGELCVEPGRRVAGETGSWSPAWGTFTDGPTLIGTPAPDDGDWQPFAPPPDGTNGCTNRYDDSRRHPRALVMRELGPRLNVLAGVLRPDEAGVTLTGPDGAALRVAVRGRLFLAAVPVARTANERATLTIARDRGRPLVVPVATGDQDHSDDVEVAVPREGGRVVRVAWLGGPPPFVGVDAAATPQGLRITVVERYPPAFAPDGTTYGIAAVGVPKCADVVLPDPLVGMPLWRGGGRVAPDDSASSLARSSCVRVAPGERLTLPPDGEDPAVRRGPPR